MSPSTYFLLTAAVLILAGLWGAVMVPRIIRRRVVSGELTEAHGKIAVAVRVISILLVVMGIFLIVIEIIAPLKRG